MLKFINYLIVLFLFVSCGSSIKSNFKNFNAYYNTYYNAKKNFNLGLKKSLEQERTYNVLKPIRVYETPKGAGAGEFNNAIEKGAQILRSHKDTKWVDNALEIIGKSYYYRNEYFNSIQKFEELYVNSGNVELKQKSIYWKGRVLLELEAYNEGIQFLNQELSLNDGKWVSKLEWQVKLVLAEHYIAKQNWVNALDLLNESIGKISGRGHNERGFFLIGQVNERLGNIEDAFNAYKNVEKFYTNYDLQYVAKKKKAEVARELGNIDEAIAVFRSMTKDDKNTEFISELNLELAKSEQKKGNAERANSIYKSILKDQIHKPSNKVKALTYFGLAELNQFVFDNYIFAAAYYDSSARLNIKLEELPEGYNAKILSESFGSYVDLKSQIHEQDSLLWLGSLSKSAFDSVLAKIKDRKKAQLEALIEKEKSNQNTLINLSENVTNETNDNIENGFLNIKNPVLIAQATENFKVVWGRRSLVDNWRINSLIRNNIANDSTQILNNSNTVNEFTYNVDLSIDLSRIPFTLLEQDSVKNIISRLNYELGNLFFLQLDNADSAYYYFKRVLDERSVNEVIPITLYSLSELNEVQGNDSLSFKYAKELIQSFPNSLYATKLSKKFNIIIANNASVKDVNPKIQFINLMDSKDSLTVNKAEQLAELALIYPNNEISDEALYESIKTYIKLGKQDSIFISNYNPWFKANTVWQLKNKKLSALKDSLEEIKNNPELEFSTADSLLFASIEDSVLVKPSYAELNPYKGAMWDSTRSKIGRFTTYFSDSKYANQVKVLKSEFEISVTSNEIISNSLDEVQNDTKSEYLDCEEANFSLELRTDIDDQFISFVFYINQRGIIDEFTLTSNTNSRELILAYEQAIENTMVFEPVLMNGEAKKIKCEIEFEIPK